MVERNCSVCSVCKWWVVRPCYCVGVKDSYPLENCSLVNHGTMKRWPDIAMSDLHVIGVKGGW